MKLISCELKGYRRLSLNHIDCIKLTPESKIQLILGSNGSGKSSLLRQLSPLLPNHTEYRTNGYRISEYLHKKHVYILKNTFEQNKHRHSFLKDSVELNPGGTATIFKELVKVEFGITPDIHALMLGNIEFHSMDMNERRQWIMRISDSDFTFAVQFYQKLKEQLRDIQGAVKVSQSRLVYENNKLLNNEEESKMRKEVTDLNHLLSELLEMKTPSRFTQDELNRSIRRQEPEIERISNQILECRRWFANHENFNSPEELDKSINQNEAEVRFLQSQSDDLFQQIEKEQLTLDALEKADLDSSVGLDSKIETYQHDVDLLQGQMVSGLCFISPDRAYQALLSVYDNLTEIFSGMGVNENRQLGRQSYAAAVEYGEKLKTAELRCRNLLATAVETKKIYDEALKHGQMQCPACDHLWHRDYDITLHRQASDAVEAYSRDSTAIAESIKKNNQVLEENKTYLEMFRTYMNISKAWAILSPLWEYLEVSELIFKAPKSIASLLAKIKGDLQLGIRAQALQISIDETKKLKALVAENQQISSKSVQEKIDSLNGKQYVVNRSIKETRSKLSRFKIYKTTIAEMNNLSLKLNEVLTQREADHQELINVIQRDALNQAVSAVKSELVNKEQMIARVNVQRSLVEDIEKQLLEYNEKVEILKIAVKEMSPTEGLIAKGLIGFINHFVNQINAFIRKIWLTPMELLVILPDKEDGIDLDYRFEVRVNDNDEEQVPDIAVASNGMREIINLAFRIVALHHLGLEDAPLFLDEFASKMDHAHRNSAFHVITTLLTSSNASQIFMISHNEQSYGSLKNTDITVLCPANVILPKDMAFNVRTIIS